MDGEEECIEIDHDENQGGVPISGANSLVAKPVYPGESGEGSPYAPENWPNPGDVWKWKVGKKKNPCGFYWDRYLFLPDRLQKAHNGKHDAFRSKFEVREYVKKTFPNANINEFFASFKWSVPSNDMARRQLIKGYRNSSNIHSKKTKAVEHPASKSSVGSQNCKAGNKMCNLRAEVSSCSQKLMVCHICCTETDFCRECCCILCSQTIDWEYGGYSFVKCEATMNEDYICGHVAHVNCALRSYMAGTVGGIIDLDAEYYCRRCDKKMDLIPHVTKLLHTCESLGSLDDIVKILNLGLCILRGSQKSSAKSLVHHMEMVLTKLKNGIRDKGIWKMDIDISKIWNDSSALLKPLVAEGNQITPNATTRRKNDRNTIPQIPMPVNTTSYHQGASLRLGNEIGRALESLKRSQESEYKTAEQMLHAHKDRLLGLFQQFDADRAELALISNKLPAAAAAGNSSHKLLANVLITVDHIEEEILKLRQMMKISRGFGITPKGVLEEHFNLVVDD